MPLDFISTAKFRNELLRRNLSQPYISGVQLPVFFDENNYPVQNLSNSSVVKGETIDDRELLDYGNNIKNNIYNAVLPYAEEKITAISFMLNKRGFYPLFTSTVEYQEFIGKQPVFDRGIENYGDVTGGFTWRSRIDNPLGTRDKSNLETSLSNNFIYRDDSIMGLTQLILDSTPKGGSGRGHVGNAIDQTSKVFKDGDKMISKGSAIKFVDKFSGTESGAEYCRVWTKATPYSTYGDTMKRKGNIRKFNESILNSPFNLNIAPQNGSNNFDGSTNIERKGDGFVAKKYMFSIENLAWKTSDRYGFKYTDLPYCERGPNGGRVMWFPPYGLQIIENNSSKWTDNNFIGRVEPIFTYQGAERSGTLNFKVVVDHPSILNLLVRKRFAGMSDAESNNFILAFFAGCEDLDIYELTRRYTTLDKNEIERILTYLNGNKPTIETVTIWKKVAPNVVNEDVVINSGSYINSNYNFFNVFFANDSPTSLESYDQSYSQLIANQASYFSDMAQGIIDAGIDADTGAVYISNLEGAFEEATANYQMLQKLVKEIRDNLDKGNIAKVNLSGGSCITEDNSSTVSAYRIKSVKKYIVEQLGLIYSESNEFAYSYKENDITRTTKLVFNITDNSTSFYNEKGMFCNDSAIFTRTNNNILLDETIADAFYCRAVHINTDYVYSNNALPVATEVNGGREGLVPETISINTPAVPSLDEVKRILMKLLSECFYFDALKEDSPLIFKSLKDKLKYFHPAFHSTTPEGLNSRLTFLLQCTRPGDTIPVVQADGERTVADGRNTTFGPPPICILRIGDFYHSKIIIRDVNINYEDNVWDMNPEGIGYQPMIANVQVSFSFIGGQGLKEPVAELQNALTSNFYANTEMYDYRSTATENRENFNKDFLRTLLESADNVSIVNNLAYKKQNIYGDPIGKFKTYDLNSSNLAFGTLNYDALVTESIGFLNDYGKIAADYFNTNYRKWGKTITSIMLAEANRDYHDGTFLSTTMRVLGVRRDLQNKVDDIVRTISTGLYNLDFDVFSKIRSQITSAQYDIYKANYTSKFKLSFEETVIKNIRIDFKNSEDNLLKIERPLVNNIDKINFVDQKLDGLLNKDGDVREFTLSATTSNVLSTYFSPHLAQYNTLYSSIQSKLTNVAENSITEDTSYRVNILTSFFDAQAINNFMKLFEGIGDAKFRKIKDLLIGYLKAKEDKVTQPKIVNQVTATIEFPFTENPSQPNAATIRKIFSLDDGSVGGTYNYSKETKQ